MQETDTIELDIPATYTYLNVVGACLAEVLTRAEGVPDLPTVTYNVQLAVHEICTNIVQHAYGNSGRGRITIRILLSRAPARLEVELGDTGSSFDLASVSPPDFDALQEHGYGVFLARELMDEVSYDPQPQLNRWRLIKYL